MTTRTETSGKVHSRINVTPMVDVMLVLLIIFMVVTPMLQPGRRVELARTANPIDMSDANKADALIVAVQHDGTIFLGDEIVSDAVLVQQLKDRLTTRGCAYCIDMHWKELRALGETEQRLYGLDAWEESPYYTDLERAALKWAEAVTNIRESHAPDDVYENARKHFNEKELADLTFAIATINSWNRMAISARSVPGRYQPAKTHEVQKTA